MSVDAASDPAGVIEVFADGACLGNPGPGGWACLMRWRGVEKEFSGGEIDSTNNRMELMGVIVALERLKRPSTVKMTLDSRYVLDGATKWIHGWIKNGWRTADKKPVKNQELWQRLHAAAQPHKIDWNWVKGHAGHPENERVDVLARTAAEAAKRGELSQAVPE